jgi:3-isopropylmalate dehydrogenase
MLIEQLGEKEAADKIVSAIQKNIQNGKVKTYDMGGKNSTSDVGSDIARIIKGE